MKKKCFSPFFPLWEICALNQIHKFWFPSEGPNLEGNLNTTKITQYEILQVLQDPPTFILTSRKNEEENPPTKNFNFLEECVFLFVCFFYVETSEKTLSKATTEVLLKECCAGSFTQRFYKLNVAVFFFSYFLSPGHLELAFGRKY